MNTKSCWKFVGVDWCWLGKLLELLVHPLISWLHAAVCVDGFKSNHWKDNVNANKEYQNRRVLLDEQKKRMGRWQGLRAADGGRKVATRVNWSNVFNWVSNPTGFCVLIPNICKGILTTVAGLILRLRLILCYSRPYGARNSIRTGNEFYRCFNNGKLYAQINDILVLY